MLCINKMTPILVNQKVVSHLSGRWLNLFGLRDLHISSMINQSCSLSKLQYAGEGVVYLSEDPVELTNRLQLLIAEYKAGNTTTRNEIVAIADELKRKDIIDSEQYKALNSCLCSK